MDYFILILIIVSLLIVGIWLYKKRSNYLIGNDRITKGKTNTNKETNLITSDEELWSIREIKSESSLQPNHYTYINTSQELNNSISMLLRQAPKSASELMKKQDRTYLLSFSEKTGQAIKEGKLELMHAKDHLYGVRAQAVNQRGKVVEQGVLKPSKVKKFNPTQVAMGVLTTVTAQEHLQQIGNQLKKINGEINKISSAIDNKQIGNDKGNIDYMKTIFNGLDEGESTNENIRDYRQQLETIIRTTMQDLSAVEEGLPIFSRQLENEKLKGIWSANKETENVEGIINNYEKQSSIFLSKLGVMLVSLSLSKYLNPDYSADISRLNYVQMKLSNLEKEKITFFRKVNEIVPEMGARIRFKREEYNLDIQERLEKQAANLRSYFDNHKKEVEWRVERTKNDEFFDNTFGNGSADYKITIDDKQTVKSINKVLN